MAFGARRAAGSDIKTMTAFAALDSSAILPRRSEGERGRDQAKRQQGEIQHDRAH
jgi:hypothetical protein